jgi:hypothetical protein
MALRDPAKSYALTLVRYLHHRTPLSLANSDHCAHSFKFFTPMAPEAKVLSSPTIKAKW